MISVVIPTFNRERTIKRAAMSVLMQTYEDLELIVVDDCSADNTRNILKEIDDDRLRYVRLKRNSGACVARNKGIEMSKGQYVAFQDSDDEWHKDKLEKQLEYLKKNDADVCFCSLNNHLPNGEVEKIPNSKISSGDIFKRLLGGNFISTQTILGRKECFEDEKFDEAFPRFQDWDLVLRLSRKYKIVHLDKVMVEIYKQSDSMSYDFKKTTVGLKLIMEKFGGLMTKRDLAQNSFKLAKMQLLAGKSASKALQCAFHNTPSIKLAVYCFAEKIGVLYKYYQYKNTNGGKA